MVPTRYIALGDSMSIDLYPALDAGEIARLRRFGAVRRLNK
jgi:hypothetical protein